MEGMTVIVSSWARRAYLVARRVRGVQCRIAVAGLVTDGEGGDGEHEGEDDDKRTHGEVEMSGRVLECREVIWQSSSRRALDAVRCTRMDPSVLSSDLPIPQSSSLPYPNDGSGTFSAMPSPQLCPVCSASALYYIVKSTVGCDGFSLCAMQRCCNDAAAPWSGLLALRAHNYPSSQPIKSRRHFVQPHMISTRFIYRLERTL